MAKRGIDSFFSSPAKKTKADVAPVVAGSITYDKHKSYPIPLPADFPFELSTNDAHRTINDKTDLDLLYYQPLFPQTVASQLYAFLRDEFCWYRVTYQVRGLTINTPRYTTVFGLDETHSFVPNGIVEVDSGQPPKKPLKCVPRPLPGCLQTLRRHVEARSGNTYNFCLLNYYKDGTDSISYHSDDEHFLGPDPNIASISLGAARDFHMRNKADHGITFKTTLRPGDMVVMKGATQAKWDHAIPKRKGKVGGRINITFRKAVVRYGTENYYRYNVHDGPYYRWDDEQGTMVLGSTWRPKPADPVVPTQAEQTATESIKQNSTAATRTNDVPENVKEESFDVQDAVAAIEAASSGQDIDNKVKYEIGNGNVPSIDKEDSFDLEAQIKAIDEAVARAQA